VFPDETIEISGAYKDGQLDGPWLRRHPNGAIAEQGAYLAGQKDGTWKQGSPGGVALGEYAMLGGTGVEKRWYDDGAPYSEQTFKAGIANGPLRVFAPDGTVIVSARYVDGKLDGPHVFGTRQTMRFEETFVDGVRRGKRGIWQFGLQVSDETYDKRGKLDGPYVLRRSSKVLRVKGEFSGGRRIGPWTWWDRDNNKEREGTYTGGKKDGVWSEWWENKLQFTGNYTLLTFWGNKKASSKQHIYQGSLDGLYQELTVKGKVVVEGHYRADVKNGAWKEWTPEGVLLLEQSWKKGKLDGKVKKYVDGKLAMEATYVDGKVIGPYAEFRNGKPAVTGQFVDDLRDGTWTIYASDGAVLRTATYKAGVLDGAWRELADGAVLEGPMAAGRRSGSWTRTDRAGSVRTLTYTTP
jgi:antitoxin component YwqK of YwqJK toxin-antitoxin module